jgi:hypothetical protein
MIWQKPRVSRLPIQILTICAAWDSIIVPENPTLLQFGNQHINDIMECTWSDGIGL